MSMKALKRFGLKAGVMLVAVPSLVYLPYVLLGVWNRIFGGWTSVFYCYAGSTQFIDTYAPGALARAFRWYPVPIGILSHNGTRGIVIASPVSEAQFLDPAHRNAFLRLQRRIKFIAWLMGASRISLSGILPGIVRHHGVLSLEDNRPIVKHAVCAAIRRLMAEHFADNHTPVVVIGGAGHIGLPIIAALQAHGMTTITIDPKAGHTELPKSLRNQPCLILDCSRTGVLEGYVDQMWPGTMVLNEVFPRPSRKVITTLTEKGIPCWHLSGLRGSITPPLPHGYENAVPCCAAHDVGPDPEVVLVQLNPDISLAPALPANVFAA